MKRILSKLTLFLYVLSFLSPSQPARAEENLLPPGDNISQGLWWLYHLQFDQSRKCFAETILADPENPLGYFYLTAVDWWELAQDVGLDQPEIEFQFEKNYLDTVRVSESSYNSSDDPKIKAVALLCEGGAMGLRGRWFVVQKKWTKAYSLGKNGNKLLKKSMDLDPELTDATLGLGIYDYYTATLPGVMGFVAKILLHGDRKRGIEELHRTIEQSKYARVEATLFLIQIDNAFEDNHDEALTMARQLRQEFPESPLMHINAINCLYQTKNWEEGMLESKTFMDKCEKETLFYPRSGLPKGYYYAGTGTLFGNKDADECLRYMNRIISEEKETSQWVSFAYLKRGQAYDVLGKRDLAKADYKIVLSRKDVWDSHKDAAKALNHPFSL